MKRVFTFSLQMMFVLFFAMGLAQCSGTANPVSAEDMAAVESIDFSGGNTDGGQVTTGETVGNDIDPLTNLSTTEDSDQDGLVDSADNCPDVANADQANADG